MTDWIDSKRFAERWPFAAAVLMLAASVEALLVPAIVPVPVQICCLIILDSFWSHIFRQRLFGLGFSPSRLQFVTAHSLILIACFAMYFEFHTLGRYLAIAPFLVFQIPLIALATTAPNPSIWQKPINPKVTIILGGCLFLFTIAGAAAAWYLNLIIPGLFMALLAFVFGSNLYKYVRRSPDSGPLSEPTANSV